MLKQLDINLDEGNLIENKKANLSAQGKELA